jgi:hypothetical protein
MRRTSKEPIVVFDMLRRVARDAGEEQKMTFQEKM